MVKDLVGTCLPRATSKGSVGRKTVITDFLACVVIKHLATYAVIKDSLTYIVTKHLSTHNAMKDCPCYCSTKAVIKDCPT